MPRTPLSDDECARVLAGERVVRVAFHDEDALYLIPLGYVWLDSALCGVTDRGRKTELAAREPVVAFQVDTSVRSGIWEWESVTGEGRFELVEGDGQQSVLSALQPMIEEAPDWWRREQGPKLAAGALAAWKIRPQRMAGRRYGPRDSAGLD
ncbi:MAG TPA: pyridoxamine 5'-phosphate oxidase family protein [Vicinamibacterales bacterium]|nr:pyridoxamine 5'-phosphate oxidase family protein [Vicinamibacterales bacterium]